MAAGGAGAALTSLTGGDEVKAHPFDDTAIMTTEEQAASAIQTARAFGGQHQPKPLPFNPSKLNGFSEKLLRSHWANNYGGAVKALNAVEQRLGAMLGEKDLPPYMYGDLKREELVRTGSVVLHEHYFANLGGDGKASGPPYMHKVHHSRDQKETDSNYSSIFSFWDRLFGTYTAETNFQRLCYGLDGFDSKDEQTLRGLLKMPFMNYTRA